MIRAWLSRAPAGILSGYAIVASFCTYFCMYGFRKPFAAATYEGQFFSSSLGLKTAFVTSQVIGYCISKYAGIKICSEVSSRYRAVFLCGLIVFAELSLVAFALLPGNAKVIAIFANGLPLGMVWGLVVWYLEGRRTSEIMLAGLSCSYIVASGMVKDVGRWMMRQGVSEYWMPSTTGLMFLPFFFFSVWLLHQIPIPDKLDELARVKREPMLSGQRVAFMRTFLTGMVLLFVAYFCLTAYRDIRDNYQVDILLDLGQKVDGAIFTRMELWIAFGVMAAMAALNLIQDNWKGLIGAYIIMVSGTLILGVSTLLLDWGYVSGVTWMILVGLGAYLAYVPFGAVLFDRMIASTRVAGTAVFAIYLSDAIGYSGSVLVQLFKNFSQPTSTWFEFFRLFTYFLSVVGTVCLVCSCAYFLVFHRRPNSSQVTK